jgi:hypothetical protein
VPDLSRLGRSTVLLFSPPQLAELGRALVPFRNQATNVHRWFAPLSYGSDYRRHRRRCRMCNPQGTRPPSPSTPPNTTTGRAPEDAETGDDMEQ